MKHLWGYHQIYNVCAVEDTDELSRFSGQSHRKTKYGQKSTFGMVKVIHSNIKVTDNLSVEGKPVIGSLLRVR